VGGAAGVSVSREALVMTAPPRTSPRPRKPEPPDIEEQVERATNLKVGGLISLVLGIVLMFSYLEIRSLLQGRKSSVTVDRITGILYRLAGPKGTLLLATLVIAAALVLLWMAYGRSGSLRQGLGDSRYDEIRLEFARRDHERRKPGKDAAYLESIETLRAADTKNRMAVAFFVGILVVGLTAVHYGWL
jgi:hypothetical protein